jgi:hypothetical protein
MNMKRGVEYSWEHIRKVILIYPRFSENDGGDTFLRNVGMYLQVQAAL